MFSRVAVGGLGGGNQGLGGGVNRGVEVVPRRSRREGLNLRMQGLVCEPEDVGCFM